jgi:MtN3 and saliva related transmembrane protein
LSALIFPPYGGFLVDYLLGNIDFDIFRQLSLLENMKGIVTFFFGLGFVFNASLFIPQALRIIKNKSAKDVALITFLGFNFIQLNGILYGYYQNDQILLYGNLISFLSCATVTLLAILYRNQ